ncbi:MAG: hypothetical protein V7L25_10500 [Nostoc sp.]|uniref:hypothetical protein n=1 Tax=Nostoc sp. TaxID=1180 RepID=UPI002FF5A9B4
MKNDTFTPTNHPKGYEVCRNLEVVHEQLPKLCWQERVFIIHSSILALQQVQGLEV